MLKVLALYSMTYIVFLSDRQPLEIKGKTKYFIWKSEEKKNPINWQNINLPPE